MESMIIAVNVVSDQVGGGLGRAQTMAVARVESGEIADWTEHEVRWDLSHDAIDVSRPDGPGGHGGHHATIVRFLRDNQVQVVVTGHAGPPMLHTLDLMGIRVVLDAAGPARQAALAASQPVDLT